MQYIKKLIKSINIEDEQIPEEEIVQVFLLIHPDDNLTRIRAIVNKSKLKRQQKVSLFNYLKHIFMQGSYINRDFYYYFTSLIKALPLTKEQKVAIEYECSKYNKKRFKFD